MTKQINEKMTTMTTAFEDLAKEVHAKSRVLDDEKAKRWLDDVGRWIADKVDEHFDQAVQEPVDGLRSDLQGFRKEIGALGAERLSEVRTDIRGLLSEMGVVEETAKRYERQVNFVSVSRIVLALIPLSVALILVGGLVWGFTSMVGIGPLFGWIWTSFTAASVWWHKLLIALGGIGAAALFVWIVLRVSQWVYDNLR